MIPYNELLAKYNALLEENVKLKKEIVELKNRLDIQQESQQKNMPAVKNENAKGREHLNNHSSTDDKVRLFMSLFVGRADVFARRWESLTSGKSGYQPVCGNEWAVGFCDKKKYKCSECPNRNLLPLTEKDIYNHLAGTDIYCRDVVGIYPMLSDETCNFVCVDFDEENFKEDTIAFYKTCVQSDIPVYIEKSRSGNGAHIWIFFEEPVPAANARKLVSRVLTKTMENRSELSFKSYDRILPNQDTMPSGGFGNLIALPLQGKARKQGNSVFVDEEFIPYPDQWEFLFGIERVSKEKFNGLIREFAKNDDVGELVSGSAEKPWESKQKAYITAMDFPESLNIVKSNMICVPKSGLSAAAKNKIKRLAAFKNPEFYRAQAMRLPTYNKPRIISTSEDYPEHIAIPRGCEDALKEMLDDISVAYIFEDKTNHGVSVNVEFSGVLYPQQKEAVNRMLQNNIGVLSATTAFGKTVVAASIIANLKVNTLVIVHTQALLQQWKKSLENFLILDENIVKGKKKSPIGMLSAGKDKLRGIIDIAVMQSLITDGEVKELVRNYGMIIIDECHHVSAVNFEKVLKYANARYVYGLTATPTRSDGHHPIIFMLCGNIAYNVTAKSQAEKRSFEHYVVPRFTRYSVFDKSAVNIAYLYADLSKNKSRNNLILMDVINAVNSGRCPIVLTERREHAEFFVNELQSRFENVILLTGGVKAKEKKNILSKIENIPATEKLIIVATGKYVGEGFDCPRLDTLFLALPIAWKGKVSQYAGRLHRNYPGKEEVQIYDYVDMQVPVLDRMYHKRLKSYADIGYTIKSTDSNNNAGAIYNGKTFYSTFINDLKVANKEIIVFSPDINISKVSGMIKILAPLINLGVKITVITSEAADIKANNRNKFIYCVEQLETCGVSVLNDSKHRFNAVIIDRQIVWYGGVSVLSYSDEDASIIRITDKEIAGEFNELVK